MEAEQGTPFTEDARMAQFDLTNQALVGPGGILNVREDDEITRKLWMLIEGECEDAGPLQAAEKFGFSKQRYFQLRAAFQQFGAIGLRSQKRGPKTHYRRTAEIVRQIIRHRFLDGDASGEVIAQKLRQTGWVISTRSVDRVIAEYGLQKKTPPLPTGRSSRKGRDPAHPSVGSSKRRRSGQPRARRATATRRQDQ
jgi:hypothetical protein